MDKRNFKHAASLLKNLCQIVIDYAIQACKIFPADQMKSH